MDLLSAGIIYLTCGSPVAMHYIFSASKFESSTVFGSIARLIFWPAFAAKLALVAVVGKNLDTGLEKLEDARILRNELEMLAGNGTDTSAIFDLRFIFDRYVALAKAVSESPINNGLVEFLDTSDHPKTTLAKICNDRKIARIVERHFEESRQDFIELLTSSTFHNQSMIDEVIRNLALITLDEELSRSIAFRLTEGPISLGERLAA